MKDVFFPGGVWPVMITPFLADGSVDEAAYPRLIDYYLEAGCEGLFAICQSSEMERLSCSERLKITRLVKQCAGEKTPVIAVGNLTQGESSQLEETAAIHEAGADAVILVTNQFARPNEDDQVWLDRCLSFLRKCPTDIPLGFYECPFPYMRLIATDNLKTLAETGRFFFLKTVFLKEL